MFPMRARLDALYLAGCIPEINVFALKLIQKAIPGSSHGRVVASNSMMEPEQHAAREHDDVRRQILFPESWHEWNIG
jgi:hypothetical protein